RRALRNGASIASSSKRVWLKDRSETWGIWVGDRKADAVAGSAIRVEINNTAITRRKLLFMMMPGGVQRGFVSDDERGTWVPLVEHVGRALCQPFAATHRPGRKDGCSRGNQKGGYDSD